MENIRIFRLDYEEKEIIGAVINEDGSKGSSPNVTGDRIEGFLIYRY